MALLKNYLRNLLCAFPDALIEGVKQAGLRGGYLVLCVYVLRRLPLPVRLSPAITVRTLQEAGNYVDNFIQGELRHPEVELLLSQIGGHVLELGVNVGITARWWLSLGPRVDVTGIDMISESLDFSRRRLAQAGLADRANFITGAIGAEGREMEITFDDPLEGTNSLGSGSGSHRRWVTVDTVDQWIRRDPRAITLLKIDIEGHGGAALLGAEKTLKRTRWVVVETHSQNELETSARVLTAAGFLLSAFRGRTMWWRKAD